MRTVQQRGDLVLQQREKRAENHGDAVVDHRGELEAERLPSTRAFEDEDVALGESALDDGALIVSERRVPEDVMQGEVWREGEGRHLPMGWMERRSEGGTGGSMRLLTRWG